MPGIEGKLTEEMLNTIKIKAATEEYSKSEQPTSQILSPVGTRRIFQFMGNSENRKDIQAGYQSLKGTEGNFSVDKDCVFLRPESSSLNDDNYLENDFALQNNEANLAYSNDISRIDDFLMKQPERYSKENSIEEYENYLKQRKDSNNGFKQQTNKTGNSSGKTTSYQANCLVLGYQDRLFADQSRSDSQDED